VWFVLSRTDIGLIIRSGVHDRNMVDALGIDVRRVFTGVFVAGSMLAAVAGVLVGPLRSVNPDMANDVIVDAFIAVVVGGLGTVGGAVGGALFVGMAELLGALVIPGMAKAAVYFAVVVIMLVRPAGLFGGTPAQK
jgi:branched-subunit amino acid ABC-type transport system permease component